MDISEKVKNKFDNLLAEGKRILSTAGWDGCKYNNRFPPTDDYLRFRAESLNIVKRICGTDSDHYSELKRLAEAKDSDNNSYYFINCYGILEAAKNDYDGGYLFDLRSLVAAEVLGDFIDQAEMLLEHCYHVPAASLAGAILEDTLRKLSEANEIEVPEKTNINRLNTDLAKKGVYDKLVQKRITALADIRNNADHGHFDKFKAEDVVDMIKYIKRFTADYLG